MTQFIDSGTKSACNNYLHTHAYHIIVQVPELPWVPVINWTDIGNITQCMHTHTHTHTHTRTNTQKLWYCLSVSKYHIMSFSGKRVEMGNTMLGEIY